MTRSVNQSASPLLVHGSICVDAPVQDPRYQWTRIQAHVTHMSYIGVPNRQNACHSLTYVLRWQHACIYTCTRALSVGNGWLLVHDINTGECLYGVGANQAAVRCLWANQERLIAAGDDGNAAIFDF